MELCISARGLGKKEITSEVGKASLCGLILK